MPIILLALAESLNLRRRSTGQVIKVMQLRGLWQAVGSPIGMGVLVAFAAILGQTLFSSTHGLSKDGTV